MAYRRKEGFWRWFKRITPAQRRAFAQGRMRNIFPYDGNFMRRAARQGYVEFNDGTIWHETDELVTPTAKEGDNMGQMSKDRVQFQAAFNNEPKMRDVMVRAFGMTDEQANQILLSQGTVICRPSQFARFLIWRDEAGLRNGFKEMQAQLVPAEPYRRLTIINVAENPANV